jgi:hypothetical protein
MEHLVILKNPALALGSRTVDLIMDLDRIALFFLKALSSSFPCRCKFQKSNSRLILTLKTWFSGPEFFAYRPEVVGCDLSDRSGYRHATGYPGL